MIALRWALALTASLQLPACSPADQSASESSDLDTPASVKKAVPAFCGGEVDPMLVAEYFTALERALVEGGDLRGFVAERFIISGDDGRTVFKKADFNSIPARFISSREWMEISKRGSAGLQDMGWRGCTMSLGKVWFQSTETGGVELSAFSPDLEWEAHPLAD